MSVGDLVAQFGEGHRVDVERLMALVNQPGSGMRLLPGDRLNLGSLPDAPEAVLARVRELEQVMTTQAA